MGVSTKVFVNFKSFSQDNLHIVNDFIDYVKILGCTNKTNLLGKDYLDDSFNMKLDKWSMSTRFPFTTESGNKRGCFIDVALTEDRFTYHPQYEILEGLYTVSFDLGCNDEAKEILQGFSEKLKEKLSGCDAMIVYVPNDFESSSENIVIKEFNWETKENGYECK